MTAPNPHACLKEGDTPSWFYSSHGLGDPGTQNGAVGRAFPLGEEGPYRDAQDQVDRVTDARATVWRWRPAFQADFAARMEWCVRPVKEANHPPVPVVNKDTTGAVAEVKARSGDVVRLSAAGSTDPDGDKLSFHWFVYPEVGTYGRDTTVTDGDSESSTLTIPADAGGKSIHVSLAVTDLGKAGSDALPPRRSRRRTAGSAETRRQRQGSGGSVT